MLAIWRIDTVKSAVGYRSHASIYTAIRAGLFPKPVLVGPRAVGWPSEEVQTIIAARIAGKTEAEIKHLVDRLHAKRLTSPLLPPQEAGA